QSPQSHRSILCSMIHHCHFPHRSVCWIWIWHWNSTAKPQHCACISTNCTCSTMRCRGHSRSCCRAMAVLSDWHTAMPDSSVAPLQALLPPAFADSAIQPGHFTYQLAPAESGDEIILMIAASDSANWMTLSSPQGIFSLSDSNPSLSGRLWRDRYALDLVLPA